MPAGCELDAPPDAEWHDPVVDDMQGGNLIVSLSHDEEECVEEFSKFAEEIPPTTVRHLFGDRLSKQL